jgi:protein-L-isoaspartate(D-aspartate) O-methyltransferase
VRNKKLVFHRHRLQLLQALSPEKKKVHFPNMSWRCSGTTNQELISNLQRFGRISERVHEAFLKVDRAHFSPTEPYADAPQRIGYDATISAPHMHASASEALLEFLNPGSKVLDVGCGSGYLTAVLAHLVVGFFFFVNFPRIFIFQSSPPPPPPP